jgi:hypothetical protein
MYKALTNFSGIKVSMSQGDVIENIPEDIAKDLLRAGYIEVYPAEEVKKKKTAPKKATPKK